MATQTRLPKDVISLIEHVELHEQGWWNRALELLVLSYLLGRPGSPQSARAVQEVLQRDYQLSLDDDRVRDVFAKLKHDGRLVEVAQNVYKIAETESALLRERILRSKELESKAKQHLGECLSQSGLSLGVDALWTQVYEGCIVPLLRDLGTKTYEIITGVLAEDGSAPRFTDFLDVYAKDYQEGVWQVVQHFLGDGDANVAAFLLSQMNAFLLIESCKLTQSDVVALQAAIEHKPKYVVVLDTNVVFSVLSLHDNPANESVSTLFRLSNQVKSYVDLEYWVLPITISEARRVLRSTVKRLGGARFTSNIIQAINGMEVCDVSSVVSKFLDVSKQTREPLNAREFFQPYLDGLEQMLGLKGVLVQNVDTQALLEDSHVRNEIQTRCSHESDIGIRRPRDAVEHDIALYEYVARQRRGESKAHGEPVYWLATVDFALISHDRFQRKSNRDALPVCVHPANLTQMLQLWAPRTHEFEQAILTSVFPLLDTSFDANAEQATLDITRVISRYEKSGDIPVEVVRRVYLDRGMRDALSTEKNEDAREKIIDGTLARRVAESEEERNKLAQKVLVQDEEIKSLQLQISKPRAAKSSRKTNDEGKAVVSGQKISNPDGSSNEIQSLKEELSRQSMSNTMLKFWMTLMVLVLAVSSWIWGALSHWIPFISDRPSAIVGVPILLVCTWLLWSAKIFAANDTSRASRLGRVLQRARTGVWGMVAIVVAWGIERILDYLYKH